VPWAIRTSDRTGLTGPDFRLVCKAAAEKAADGLVSDMSASLTLPWVRGRRWSRLSRASRRVGAIPGRGSDYELCWMLFDNRVEIIGCARRTR
jgi:hypothetical protein